MYQARGCRLCVSNLPLYGAGETSERHTAMRRFRSLISQSPAIAISILALALSAGGGAYASTHLSAASTPAGGQAITTGVSWTSLSLINGWISENATYQSGNPKVAQQNGIVYLSGSLAQPGGGSSEFAVLPSADRPTHNMWITVYTNGDTQGSLYIGHDGTMEAFSATGCGSQTTAQCFTSLATVSYPINS
jgi:hypothetical protein